MTEERPRILYIEDDDGLAFLARRALTRAGFEIFPAGTVAAGLCRFRMMLSRGRQPSAFAVDG